MRKFLILMIVAFAPADNLFCQSISELERGFKNPPDEAKPGVYWYFMDGNMTKESITKDLESMKAAGLNSFVFLEVNVGIPRGKTKFFSDEWLGLFAFAVKESERLGIEIHLGTGPGWTGSGGPWVKPDESMQVLVGSSTLVSGELGAVFKLTKPPVKKPFFAMPKELDTAFRAFYEDVSVLAFPALTPFENSDQKALYYRPPYNSHNDALPSLNHLQYLDLRGRFAIHPDSIIDLTPLMDTSGTLRWTPPPGTWQVVRFGRRNNGASTRPAPMPGLGFESDKFDTAAFKTHFDKYIGKIIEKTGKPSPHTIGGIKYLHMDSWEMGAQNWTKHFRQEFMQRRGYDPLPYYPVYLGMIVKDLETSERFLWDLRRTSQELIIANHALYAKRLAHDLGLKFSVQPYDMNPASDLELGNIADMPMGEFWAKGFGFKTAYSVIEAASTGHVNGKRIIAAEAFTAENKEGWRHYPGNMKNQSDWALAAGINRLMYHTFQNQFLPDTLRPGATMGPYGIQWNRNQTFWPWVHSYHQYITRCQYLLQQGRTVADILYLQSENLPNVFLAPQSAMQGNDTIPDKREYNFDACAPSQLLTATVKNGRIVFPSGASYQLLVMPVVNNMTVALLKKILELVEAGATVVGVPPTTTPGLQSQQQEEELLRQLVNELWGKQEPSPTEEWRAVGKGKIISAKGFRDSLDNGYPHYAATKKVLSAMKVLPNFTSTDSVRYIQQTGPGWEMYFIANTTADTINPLMQFRTRMGKPTVWDPVKTQMVSLPKYTTGGGQTELSLKLYPYQSYFVLFAKDFKTKLPLLRESIFIRQALEKPWQVSFDTAWGGPEKIAMDTLKDWSKDSTAGIKYYSGKAVYQTTFDMGAKIGKGKQVWLDLGEVRNIARIWLNGKDLGILWTAPWQADISNLLRGRENLLKIEVINLWANRLIGDEQVDGDGIYNGEWPRWLEKGEKRPGKRYTFTTSEQYRRDSPLQPSGLLGPVSILVSK